MIVEYWEQWCKSGSIRLDNRGRIGKNAKEAFMSGQCHSLAAAIHTLTGWQIVGFVDFSIDDTRNSPGHCAIKIPNKKDYLDIKGLGALVRHKELYPDAKVYKLTHKQLANLDCYLPLNEEIALPFAKTVLKKYLGIDVT